VRETMQPAHASLWLRSETSAEGEQAELLPYSPEGGEYLFLEVQLITFNTNLAHLGDAPYTRCDAPL
jgi:hypothetical protein